jgi:hypothetical protein
MAWENNKDVQSWRHGVGYWSMKPPYNSRDDMAFYYGKPPPGSTVIDGVAGLTPFVKPDIDISLGFQRIRVINGVVTLKEDRDKAHYEKRSLWRRESRVIKAISKNAELTIPKFARFDLKREILFHYSRGSMRCACCGFMDLRALSIDHMNSNGADHRREINGDLYTWLKRNNYPCGYQVLCMNCQWVKRAVYNETR